jgi:hypothetical protein
MRISNVRAFDSPAGQQLLRLAADVSYGDRPGAGEVLWFDVPKTMQDKVTTSADPWLAALLPLAGKIGEDIDIDGAVDSTFYECTLTLLEWWRFWFPEFKIVSVHPQSLVSESSSATLATAQFFSGGVDSFFTLLRHMDDSRSPRVDNLLIGWGFDIPLSDETSFKRVTDSLEHVARELGCNLVPFSTNFRETRLRELPWGEVAHGNAMAAVALLLQPAYRRVLIPSTDGYREKGPWGSHATTDQLYSTSGTRIIHDGAAFTRFEKIKCVAASDAALSALRVCWRLQSDENCGGCEKCLRTMIALELAGVLGKASTFGHATLETDRIRRIYCPHTETGPFDLYYEEMRDAAIGLGRSDIADAIKAALLQSKIKQPLLAVTQRLSWNRFLGPVGRPLDSALRRSIIV